MVPGKILDYATSRGSAHFLNDLRMLVQMLERRCDGADICRLHDDAFDAIAHNIARFARGDLRQRAGRRFV